MPSKGSLPARLADAMEIAAARLELLVTNLDRMTDPGEIGGPFGGQRITRTDFRHLLASDPQTQDRVLAKRAFATEQERDALDRQLAQVAPTSEALPASVTLPPALPFPPAQAMGADLATGPPQPGSR